MTETFCPVCRQSVNGLHFHHFAEVQVGRWWLLTDEHRRPTLIPRGRKEP